ncbi:interactor of HORMAD1 protein 1 [Ochotona princeps]|uniref:interactor of HORMAD1 protein 1 n=1 Tax=Ochotona princeps TaxID=9978 RepID=UPI002714C2D8|nr:interactor of HORMAD1 protein 1 [Ochotona princeps]
MDFNVWNIKEMLSIPSVSGNTRAPAWNNNQPDYSSLSDSQFLFGSQFCPENAETLAAPLDIGTHLRQHKQTQQAPLDNEPSIFAKYQAKPLLFGSETKDGSLFPLPLLARKSKGILEQFEEKKKMAKDKYCNETLCSFVSHVRESIHRLQTSVEKSEEHLSARSQTILDSLETVVKTVQETARTQSDLLVEAVREKAILEMQRTFEVKQAEFTEVKSDLKHLEVLVAQQSKDFQQLCEQLGQLDVPGVLVELRRWLTEPRRPGLLRDSASQTSPLLARGLSFPGQENGASQGAGPRQAQALPESANPSTASVPPGQFDFGGRGAKISVLLEEAALPEAQPHQRKGWAEDETVQITHQDQDAPPRGSKNSGSHIPGHRDQVGQGASQLTSQDADTLATAVSRNVPPRCQGESRLSREPRDQLGLEQRSAAPQTVAEGRQPQPREVYRGRLPVRQWEPAPGRIQASRAQPPAAVPQRRPLEQREAVGSQGGPGSPAQSGRLVRRSAPRPARARRLPRRRSPVRDSSLEDRQMRWFNELGIRCSAGPARQEPGKPFLFDPSFDSSDEDCF